MATLGDQIFADEDAARAHFEAIRWPDGKPICPHCGVVGETTLIQGKSHRAGLHMCNACREPFTVTVGTLMEKSHIPLHKWALGFHLMAASKKGISAHQLHRQLGITYKSAWFMAHRIREAMRDDRAVPMGGTGKIVEADETYYGRQEMPRISPRRKGRPYKRGPADKRAVLALVERDGDVRTFHVAVADADTVVRIVNQNVNKESRLHTDESKLYTFIGSRMAGHETVKHSAGEYVRGDIHTNTIEGFFSIFKRGMQGVYQHCSEQHLHRYLSEFDFRYSHRIKLGYSDNARAMLAIRGAAGKRLTYRAVSA
jgi:transposase-like protein